MGIAVTLHLLAATIWVGGMFFAYLALRPAAATTLDPPLRLKLWAATFKRFFFWVWLSVLIIMASGYWMIFNVFGGFEEAGTHVRIMHIAGWIMVAIYMHVFFAPYRRMRLALIAEDLITAASKLAQIRLLVGINLLIGLCIFSIAAAGRYIWF